MRKKRILYFERLKRNDNYDVLIRDNISNTEPEVIEKGYEIINQIVYSYKQSLKEYNKELDELLTVDTGTSNMYHPRTIDDDGKRKNK
jgi:hypothetical protein